MNRKKADVNEEYFGLTWLMFAAKLRYADPVDLLSSNYSVKLAYRNHLAENAFSLAVFHGGAIIIETLTNEQDIDLNNQSSNGSLPLTTAPKFRQSYISQLILQYIPKLVRPLSLSNWGTIYTTDGTGC